MKHLAAIFLLLAAAAAYGQTVKSLGYNTTNGEVVYTGTNALTFTNSMIKISELAISNSGIYSGASLRINLEDATLWGDEWTVLGSLNFGNSTNKAITRENLFGHGGISTNFVVGTNTLVFTNGILKEVQ